jgi:nucleoside-diphosphate-sugar epimerase
MDTEPSQLPCALGRCFVTGGGGFLGTELVRQLRAAGCEVTSGSRRPHPQLADLGARETTLDVRDPIAVRAALAGHQTVFHVAALPGAFGPRESFWSINAEGTRNVVDAVRSLGIERLVHTSSPSVVFDGEHHRQRTADDTDYPARFLSPYPESKAEAERIALSANDSSLATVALRPHLIVGPGDPNLLPRVIARAAQGRLAIVGDGTNRVSITDVRNAAAAHLDAALSLRPGAPHAGRAYFVNQSEPVALWDWIGRVLDAAGAPRPHRRLSAAAAYRVGAVLEAVWRLTRLGGEPPMTRFVAQQLALDHTYSIAPAERDFGYRERHDLEACTQSVLAWVGRPESSR